jgi:hypothetical protein
MKTIYSLFFAFIISSCVSKTDYDKLLLENYDLKQELKKYTQEEEEEEEEEEIVLTPTSNANIWNLNYFVDDFGEKTKNAFLSTVVEGVFSNTATENSKLYAGFIIRDSSSVYLQLFEYGGNNPVKASSREDYIVMIQDKDGERLRLEAVNYSDRIGFSNKSVQVHNALMKGGNLKFRMYEKDRTSSNYSFEIENADQYSEIFSKLKISE